MLESWSGQRSFGPATWLPLICPRNTSDGIDWLRFHTSRPSRSKSAILSLEYAQ
jgi:hypothetical protein